MWCGRRRKGSMRERERERKRDEEKEISTNGFLSRTSLKYFDFLFIAQTRYTHTHTHTHILAPWSLQQSLYCRV